MAHETEVATVSDDQTFTLNEARDELRRQDCERDGHPPRLHLGTLSDRVGYWMCECGGVTWKPNKR